MERKPFEEVMEDVNKWAAPEVSLRQDVAAAKLGYPIVLPHPLLLIRKITTKIPPRMIQELEALYRAAKNGHPCIGDMLADLMEKYREEKYDPSRKLFFIVAVLKYSDGTGEPYWVKLPSDVLEIDKENFELEVIRPQVAKIAQKIGWEADYWDVTDYTIMCYQI